MTRRDDYVNQMKQQLDALNLQMSKAESQVTAARDDARTMIRQELATLRQRSKQAAYQFEVMKAAGEEAWEAMVADMDKLRDTFSQSFHYFKSPESDGAQRRPR